MRIVGRPRHVGLRGHFRRLSVAGPPAGFSRQLIRFGQSSPQCRFWFSKCRRARRLGHSCFESLQFPFVTKNFLHPNPMGRRSQIYGSNRCNLACIILVFRPELQRFAWKISRQSRISPWLAMPQ
jgi:hypothetical protein